MVGFDADHSKLARLSMGSYLLRAASSTAVATVFNPTIGPAVRRSPLRIVPLSGFHKFAGHIGPLTPHTQNLSSGKNQGPGNMEH